MLEIKKAPKKIQQLAEDLLLDPDMEEKLECQGWEKLSDGGVRLFFDGHCIEIPKFELNAWKKLKKGL